MLFRSFKILNNIGKGSFSKVKKVLRISTHEEFDNDADEELKNKNLFAMKVSLTSYYLINSFLIDDAQANINKVEGCQVLERR